MNHRGNGRWPFVLVSKTTVGQPGTGVNPGQIAQPTSHGLYCKGYERDLSRLQADFQPPAPGRRGAGRVTLWAKGHSNHERRGGVLLHNTATVKLCGTA